MADDAMGSGSGTGSGAVPPEPARDPPTQPLDMTGAPAGEESIGAKDPDTGLGDPADLPRDRSWLAGFILSLPDLIPSHWRS
jgi:hypothetical protein